MYQLNYPVPGTCTSSTILYQGQVQLSHPLLQGDKLNYPLLETSTAQLPLFHEGKVELNYASRDKYSTVHVTYPILHGGKYSLTIHFMEQVKLSYPLYWMGDKYMQPNYPLLETSTAQLPSTALGTSTAQLPTFGNKYFSSVIPYTAWDASTLIQLIFPLLETNSSPIPSILHAGGGGGGVKNSLTIHFRGQIQLSYPLLGEK
jgi:hypothetical protein